MAHPASRLRWLRGIVVAQLALLAIQFEFGENLSIAGAFPSVPPAGFAAGAFATYVVAGAASLVIHTVLGFVIFGDAVLAFALSWLVRVRWLPVVIGVELALVISAGFGGFFFVLSGFNDNNSSYQMSTGFLVVFVFAFLSLYLMKGPFQRPSGDPAFEAGATSRM
jgi:hypothetical protein